MAYEYDLSEYEKKGQKYKEQAQQNAEIAASNIQKSYEPSINQIQQEQKGLTAQYDQQRATNDWNTRVAARNFMEQMANIGNADSGLNRSGQARIQAANIQNAGAINLAQQSASNDLTTALNKIIAERDLNIANTRQEYLERGQEQYDNYMAAMEQAEIDAAAQRYAADKEFETQKAEREFEWAKLQQQHSWDMEKMSQQHQYDTDIAILKAGLSASKNGGVANEKYVTESLNNAKSYGVKIDEIAEEQAAGNKDTEKQIKETYLNKLILQYFELGQHSYKDDAGKVQNEIVIVPKDKTDAYENVYLTDIVFQTILSNAGISYPTQEYMTSVISGIPMSSFDR